MKMRVIILLGLFLSCSALLAKEAEMDVVTPITTVPVINPTITPPTTTTTPVYNPFPTISSPVTPTPITNPFSTPAMMTPSGQNWCVASQTASQTALQVALDYACGYGGADCSAIQKGGSCFDPDTLRDHASYAFNDYYQRNPVPTSCDFGGTASIVNADPSTSTCHYPSTSTSPSPVVNTTYPSPATYPSPSGSDVYGSSVPPSTEESDSASILNSVQLWISLVCLLVLLGDLSVSN
ncbi:PLASMODESMATA CALLOSE-BINDING PROTEIN 3-like isoform X2 [Zingiber officinale]|uniref:PLASMODESMATA CALLOSE-BINDING PROTEIN 3-like isoform X2 n=1 Tax=Zingiber officinale TaxID=94328 RepID=UPI001C4D9171|nr:PLASMODESMATA CALLOSE-BINDING PROTEIN 3-like isoform X2 [Zingiber officinale]